MLSPSWSQTTATNPAHSTFLQLLTSPPSNQERGEGRKHGVVACFISSAGHLHGHATGPNAHEMPKGHNSSLLNGGCSDHFSESLSRVISVFLFSQQRLGTMKGLLSGSLMLNKVNLMSLSMVTGNTLLHRDVKGCISQSVILKLLLGSSSGSRTGAGRSPPPLPPTSPPS